MEKHCSQSADTVAFELWAGLASTGARATLLNQEQKSRAALFDAIERAGQADETRVGKAALEKPENKFADLLGGFCRANKQLHLDLLKSLETAPSATGNREPPIEEKRGFLKQIFDRT